MTDDVPPGWPTAEQRARVDARSRALRLRRRLAGATALAVVVAIVAGGVVIARRGPSAPQLRTAGSPTTTVEPAPGPTAATVPTPTTTHPLDFTPEPRGWRLVDYGDARFALPPGWSAVGPGSSSCAPVTGDAVTLLRDGPGCAYVMVAPWNPSRLPARPALTIHGIDLYLGFGSPVAIDYAVPALGVEVSVHDTGAARRVLDTLTLSARRVALDPGDGPAVPASWKTLTFGGISLRVPPTMAVTNLAAHQIPPGGCDAVPFPHSGAFLGNGENGVVNCPMVPAGVVPVPTDGVWMRAAGARTSVPPTTDRTIEIGSVHLAVAFVSGYGVLDLEPAVDVRIIGGGGAGNQSATVVRIGLGPDPTVARRILSSIRPAA